MADNSIRIGVDVGGTFTDFALATPLGIKTLKLPTTEDAPEHAILQGIGHLLTENKISSQSVDGIVHGTTLATNAIISRTGARTALLTTEVFQGRHASGCPVFATFWPKATKAVSTNMTLTSSNPNHWCRGGGGSASKSAFRPREKYCCR